MSLIKNWKEVLKKAWSVRLGALSAFTFALSTALLQFPPELLGLTAEQLSSASATLNAFAGLFALLVVPARSVDQNLAK